MSVTRITPTAWDVVLFPSQASISTSNQLSARAAFQAALHERVVLVDIRDAAARAIEGEVAPGLDPHYVGAADLAHWLRAASEDWDRVVLLSGRGHRSEAARRWLNRRFPHLDIVDVRGGFRSWQREGMPTCPSRG